ncbi:peptidoglycan-binding protein [Aerococcaceae bacterium DSM 111020]|nr:peptidoglycan-binding protein [Aerococcaceae bacterium DSM 111020]
MKKTLLTLLSCSLVLSGLPTQVLAQSDDSAEESSEVVSTEETTDVSTEEVSSEEATEETGSEEAEAENAEETSDDAAATESETEEETESADEQAENAVTIKMGYGAPHGDKSFAVTYVVMDGDVVTHAYIDEFQFLEEAEGVPNSDGAFADGFAEGVVLASKRQNDEAYSANMEEIAGATQTYGESMDAVQAFAEGKTLEEIQAAIDELGALPEDGSPADVVSGSTFADTSGYLQTIIDVAEEGFEFQGEAAGDIANAEFSYSLQPLSQDTAVSLVGVLHDGETIYAVAQDELQFNAEGEGVPNSDAGFGEGIAEGNVLISKLENDEAYSANMTEIAGATQTYSESLKGISEAVAGKTVEEVEAMLEEVNNLGEEDNVADVVSGSTFSSMNEYLEAIINTLK